MKNPLHDAIGRRINDEIRGRWNVVRDPACSGKQYIPLFCEEKKSSANRLCNVDLLIHDGSRVFVVVEIEESNVKPTQICGKFFTTAFSKFYIHKNEKNKPISFAKSFLFVQVVRKINKEKTKKFVQWKLIEDRIRGFLKKSGSKIQYELICTDTDNVMKSEIVSRIKEYLEKQTA